MIKVKRFDNFEPILMDCSVLTSFNQTELDRSNILSNTDKDVEYIIPLPKDIDVVDSGQGNFKGTIDVDAIMENRKGTFTFEDKLYLHPNCTIPRAKVTAKYTRVLSPTKADVCVIPNYNPKMEVKKIAIFINKADTRIYIMEPRYQWSFGKNGKYTAPTICEKFTCGTKVTDINPFLKGRSIEYRYYYPNKYKTTRKEAWESFINSELIYYGWALSVSNSSSWIDEFLNKKIHHVVTETKILETLGDETNELTKDIYDSILEMLRSRDESVIGLGLKSLAELDYKKYFNTAIHLLNRNRFWEKNDARKTSSVKYMLKYLGMWGRVRENYSSTITPEDFAMMQQVVFDSFVESKDSLISQYKNKYPFAVIDSTFEFTVSPIIPEGEFYPWENKENDDDFLDDGDDLEADE